MKISKTRLQQIIKEEVAAIREEEPAQLELPGMDVNQLLDNAANYFKFSPEDLAAAFGPEVMKLGATEVNKILHSAMNKAWRTLSRTRRGLPPKGPGRTIALGEKILDILRDPVFTRDALDRAMQPAELPSDIAADEEDDRQLDLPFKDVQLASAANFFSLPADELKAALDPDGTATFAEINKRIGDAMRVAWRNMTDEEKDADRGSDKMANTGQRLIKILQQG